MLNADEQNKQDLAALRAVDRFWRRTSPKHDSERAVTRTERQEYAAWIEAEQRRLGKVLGRTVALVNLIRHQTTANPSRYARVVRCPHCRLSHGFQANRVGHTVQCPDHTGKHTGKTMQLEVARRTQ